MNYSQYITAMGDLLQYAVVDSTSATPFADTDINNILPDMISYAELRMYREFDFLSTIVTATATLVAGTRTATIPSTLVVLESMNAITPVGKAPDASGSTRNTIQRTSIEFINSTWPSVDSQGLPIYYAPYQSALTTNPNPTSVIFGPNPDLAYTVEFLGTARPTTLSSANTSTFLTLNMPDMFISASMVFGSGFQQNYGAQSENPQLATSWEAQYQLQKAGVMVEELRKKAQSTDWQPYLPSPLAQRQ